MEDLARVETILRQKGGAVYSVRPEETVFHAIRIMKEKDIGAVLVMGEGRLTGILSERDYARKAAFEGRDSRATPVHDICTRVVVTVSPETTVRECLQLMTDRRLRHLPVVEGDKVVGVVSIGDLVKWLINALTARIDQLQAYISGGYPS